MTFESVIVLVSPVAGGGRALSLARPVAAGLASAGVARELSVAAVEVVETRSAEHAEAVAAAAGSSVLVVAIGGDGLVGRAAAGCVASGAVLLPLPGGRGNDFAASMGWVRPRSWPLLSARARALAVSQQVGVAVRRGLVRSVDMIRVASDCDDVPTQSRIVAGVVSIGLDALASEIANRATGVPGPFVYPVAAARAFAAYSRPRLRITTAGGTFEVNGWLVAVANIGRYGGGLRIAPPARSDDGWLDLITIGPMRRAEFVPVFARVARGWHLGHREIEHTPVREVRIEQLDAAHCAAGDAQGRLTAYADGDPIGPLPVRIMAEPAALRVLLP